MKVLEVKGLCKNYPNFSLKDVTFSVEAGKITGFIGRNGAGKSTTMKAVLNLVHPDSGEISYFGKPLVKFEEEIKKNIGFCAGAVNWYPRKKIGEVLAVARSCYDNWNQMAFERYVSLFGLDLNKRACELSEGMKVKCNLLISLSHKANLLILDEPTSGLDPFSREELLELFDALKRDGIAIFFSTHIISDLQKCADNIIYISRGQVVEVASKSDFEAKFSLEGESLEETFLRLEREALDEC